MNLASDRRRQTGRLRAGRRGIGLWLGAVLTLFGCEVRYSSQQATPVATATPAEISHGSSELSVDSASGVNSAESQGTQPDSNTNTAASESPVDVKGSDERSALPANEKPAGSDPRVSADKDAGEPKTNTTSSAETKRASNMEPEGITFDDLNLQMQQDMVFREWMLTDRAKELDGRKVRIAGAMLGGQQPKGIKEFVLLKNKECKFGPGGQADHVINVLMQGGHEVAYTDTSVELMGVLRIKPIQGPTGTNAVYELQAESFKKLRK